MTATLKTTEIIELLDEHLPAAAELFAAGYREAHFARWVSESAAVASQVGRDITACHGVARRANPGEHLHTANFF